MLSVDVIAYAGGTGEEEPRMVCVGKRRIEVIEVLERWREPGRRHFRVHPWEVDRYLGQV